MQTAELMKTIKNLPLSKRFFVVEETLKSIKRDELKHELEHAVNELYDDYASDAELTAFTSLDLEDFYETK